MARQLPDVAGAGEAAAKREAKLSKLVLSVKGCAIRLTEKTERRGVGGVGRQLDQHFRDSAKTMRLDLHQVDQESQL